ncbi:hypothetical protein [Paenibacillus germinis]|uniref:hypothetical protein n=1 Tax=Paenibacillus germinis TaxID=2654979 RepID=UPI001490BC6B|nr:hypothetical protein [Paenibacillus germinis]
MTKKRSIGSIVGYLILGIILLIAVILFMLYLGILDLEKRERGFVELPNNYGVLKILL